MSRSSHPDAPLLLVARAGRPFLTNRLIPAVLRTAAKVDNLEAPAQHNREDGQ